MSPQEVKAPNPEDETLPVQAWVSAGSVLFDVSPEIVRAALSTIIKETDDPDSEPRFDRDEVTKAVENYLKAPATRG